MKAFIENLLPRIGQFSSTLERREIFVDAPWVVVDEHSNQQKYIFRRNGDLIMSLNGQVTIGKWEYLESAQSLLIDRIQDKILLNQKFVHPAVMILKRDGIGNDYMVLGNEKLLPNLDVNIFLKNVSSREFNPQQMNIVGPDTVVSVEHLMDGSELQLLNFRGTYETTKVMIGGLPVKNCVVQVRDSRAWYHITDSTITYVGKEFTYPTNMGDIVIVHGKHAYPDTGNFVFQNGKPAPDGKYRLGALWHKSVKDGKII